MSMLKLISRVFLLILFMFLAPISNCSAQVSQQEGRWSDSYSVEGDYANAQDVCDAKSAKYGWPRTYYSPDIGANPPHGSCFGRLPDFNPLSPVAYPAYYSCPINQRFFFDTRACETVTAQPPKNSPGSDPANNGAHCPFCGQPINPGTGNMWHTEIDYVGPGDPAALTVNRTYNSSPYSIDARVLHGFGRRWTYPYDATLKSEVPPTAEINFTCWLRNSTGYIWCDPAPVPVTTSSIPQAVSILRKDGKKYYFSHSGTSWTANAGTNDRVTAQYTTDGSDVDGWTYTTAEGDVVENYDKNGKLISITSRSGAIQRLTYSNGISNDSGTGRSPVSAPICAHVQMGAILPGGTLLCVTDNWGRQLQFEYDSNGRISKTIDPATGETIYGYDGPSGGCVNSNASSAACSANNLTQVTYSNGRSRIYYYNEASQINGGGVCPSMATIGSGFGPLLNSLTGLVDENGDRYISWTYDCTGKATSSQVGSGTQKVSLAYAKPDINGAYTTSVTHTVGAQASPLTTVRQYSYQQIQGVAKNLGIDQPCVECGTIAIRTYDANSNVASSTDFNGIKTNYSYDLSRNLETSRAEAVGTAQARTTTTTWHPNYRLPLQVAEPKRLTTFTYDAIGNLLTKSAQATTDTNGTQGVSPALTGMPRTWRYTYNAVGQVLTITGPRTDVNERTLYAYDASGNLQTITNALGHVTTLSDYDANGNVGRIVAPNGSTIDLGYTARGWLASRSVQAAGITETTTYEYDGVGQIKRVTMPDASWIAYVYDDAHRLTGVNDSAGNSMTYTLDLTGNRTREQARDPGGALRRQITRVFDTMNHIQQQTGDAQ